MSIDSLLQADPFNSGQINKIIEFENNNELDHRVSNSFIQIQNNYSKHEYSEFNKNKNEIEVYLLLEDNNTIKDMCHIKGEKDRKACNISIVPLKDNPRNRKILSLATSFSLNEMKMEEVFIKVKPDNRNVINYLTNQEYENLGEEQGYILFLKEKEERINIQRKVA